MRLILSLLLMCLPLTATAEEGGRLEAVIEGRDAGFNLLPDYSNWREGPEEPLFTLYFQAEDARLWETIQAITLTFRRTQGGAMEIVSDADFVVAGNVLRHTARGPSINLGLVSFEVDGREIRFTGRLAGTYAASTGPLVQITGRVDATVERFQ